MYGWVAASVYTSIDLLVRSTRKDWHSRTGIILICQVSQQSVISYTPELNGICVYVSAIDKLVCSRHQIRISYGLRVSGIESRFLHIFTSDCLITPSATMSYRRSFYHYDDLLWEFLTIKNVFTFSPELWCWFFLQSREWVELPKNIICIQHK